MAIVKVIKNEELVGGQDNTEVYPVTHTKAIYDGNNKQLDVRLKENDDDRKKLHQQTEKFTVVLNSPTNNPVYELTNTPNTVAIKAYSYVETFGDSPIKILDPSDYNWDIEVEDVVVDTTIDNYFINNTTTLYPHIGSTPIKFWGAYNGIRKEANVNVHQNARKYFGFSSTKPTNPEQLNTSHFSNSVGCTVTLGAKGTGYNYIYLAVPAPMVISKVIQPDSLNAPLNITSIGTINRTLLGKLYTYNLYRSVDQINSEISKRLTIS